VSNNSAWGIAAVIGACLAAACSPITMTLDNPRDGDVTHVAANQPLRVRWSDPSSTHDWVLAPPTANALKIIGQSVQPGEGGATGLELFDFAGAKPGKESLTFVYRTRGGAPNPSDETATLVVTVG
jgi:predicted secreted protein